MLGGAEVPVVGDRCLQPGDRGGDRVGGDVAGDDHLGGVGRRDARKAPLERHRTGLGERRVRQGLDTGGSGAQAEDREGGREQDQDADGQCGRRVADDGTDSSGPEGAFGGVVAPDDGEPESVDPVAEEGQQGGQQRDRRGHRDDPDDDGAEGQAAQDRVGHQEQPEQRHDEGAAGEEDRLAAGAARGQDRVDLVPAGLSFLPVPRQHEEAVVDAEREPHRGDHVDDEEGQRGELSQHRGDGNGHDDRADRDRHRDEGSHQCSEDKEEHDQRGGQPELQLTVGEVGVRELGEVVVEGVAAGDGDVEAGDGVCGDNLVEHLGDPGLGVVAEDQRDRPRRARPRRSLAGQVRRGP